MKPVVSICVPAYNQPALLARTVASIFEQNFADFEVVVTDDSDSSVCFDALKPWQSDPRLRYYRNPKPLGSPENWNESMRHALGELIKFMHHDDWFASKNSLRAFVTALKDNKFADFAFSAANACEDDGSVIFVHKPSQAQIANLCSRPSNLLFCNLIGPPSSTIFRADSKFSFDGCFKWIVDIDAYMFFLKKNPKIVYISDALINVSANGAHQVTHALANSPDIRISESLSLYAKHQPRALLERWNGLLGINALVKGHGNCLVQMQDMRKTETETLEEKIVFLWARTKKMLRRLASIKNRRQHPERVSYSQCGEDCIIDFLFMWLGISNVSYLDIGAHHPTWLSNTYFFYKKGNSGILIEPDMDLCPNLSRQRPRDKVLNVAVGLDGVDTIPLYIMSSRTLNTLDEAQAMALDASGDDKIEAVRNVQRIGINNLLETYFFDAKLNFVSLDIEGMDLPLLQAWDFARYRPEIFCVETLTYTKNNTERKLDSIIEHMQSVGYILYADTFINSIFVDKDVWNNRPHPN